VYLQKHFQKYAEVTLRTSKDRVNLPEFVGVCRREFESLYGFGGSFAIKSYGQVRQSYLAKYFSEMIDRANILVI